MPNQSTLAYELIKKWIVDGECEPGERLLEEDVARKIGVSRTSVRDGLRRLAADGLIRSEPGRGTYVLKLEPGEINEVFQLRAMLEGHGASLAAQHGEPRHFDELDRSVDQIDELLARRDLEEPQRLAHFQTHNTHFHLTLLEASQSTRLQLLARHLIEIPLVMLKQHDWPGEVQVRRSNVQHAELIRALRTRDAVLAQLIVQAHILAARPKAMAMGELAAAAS